jgi:prepilin-type N-terminal cleavage/methylation domain-containing protein
MKYQSKERGFTIVELLIVIVVIGILAALVITTFTGIQQKARNTERTTDIKAMHSSLEAYYAQAGRYPTLAEFNTDTFRSTNMKGLSDDALKDPKGANNTLVGSPTVNAYAYAPLADDDSACDNSTKDCTKYVLTAKNEGGSADTVQKSL